MTFVIVYSYNKIIVTKIEGEHVDFIDNTGGVYDAPYCYLLVDETSELLAEYSTWQEAVDSTEFKNEKKECPHVYIVMRRVSPKESLPQKVFKDYHKALDWCKEHYCDFVSELSLDE